MVDNCRGVANPDQVDNDQDEKGLPAYLLSTLTLLHVGTVTDR